MNARNLIGWPLLGCALLAPLAARAHGPDIEYQVTLLSRRTVVFEGSGQAAAQQALALTSHVLAADNAGHGAVFVDSGFKVVLKPEAGDDQTVSTSVAVTAPTNAAAPAGPAKQAETKLNLRLGEEATMPIAGYVLKVKAVAAAPLPQRSLPEDFAYLAPSLEANAATLPHVRFDRQAYQVANAVPELSAGTQTARLVAPSTPLLAEAAPPLRTAGGRP